MILDAIALVASLFLVAGAARALKRRRVLPAAAGEMDPVSVIVPWLPSGPDPIRAASALVESGGAAQAIVVHPSRAGAPQVGDPSAIARVKLVTAAPGERGTSPRSVLLAAGARAASGGWLLFTDMRTEIRPGAISGALALARDRGAPLVTVFPTPKYRGWLGEALDPVFAQWTGDGTDAADMERPEARLAAGSPAFLLVERGAYDRIGGHDAVLAAPRDAPALVRNAKRAGMRVASAQGTEAVVRSSGPLPSVLREGMDRLHACLPQGRLAAAFWALVFALVAVRPFWRLAGAIGEGGTPLAPVSLAVTLGTCASLVLHRALYHRLAGIRLRGLVLHPPAALALGFAVAAVLVQRMLRLGPTFERLPSEVLPDHDGGVDYEAVYTHRYFDGVDSVFSSWGCRDEPRYYEKVLAPLLAHVRQGRALDVGCGCGYLTRRLLSHFEVEGIDVSAHAIERCREAMPGIRFTVHNVEEPFPCSEGGFDLVTMTDLLEHVVRPDRLVENAHRALKEGGILYLTTPNLNLARRALLARADRKEHHVSLMPKAALVRLLEGKGFEVIESWTYMPGYVLGWRLRSDLGLETGIVARKAAGTSVASPRGTLDPSPDTSRPETSSSP